MALTSLWTLIIVIVAAVAAALVGVILGLRGRGERRHPGGAPVARAERVRALPGFAAAVRRRQVVLSGVVVVGILTVAIGGVVAARPIAAQTIQPETTNRDIMLCLDVSGSMTDVDQEVVTIFSDLAEDFEGERIGLTIFNSSPVQIFPLTDDYAFVQDHLDRMADSFDYVDVIPEHWVGTLNGPGASLIGDGLASCAMRFDHDDQERARSIILATDNELNGSTIVSLEEAAAYAGSRDIRVYTINPAVGPAADELIAAAQSTGGEGYGLHDTTTVEDIVTQVQEQEATALRGEARVIWSDVPQPWIVALVILSLGLVLLMWRVRL